MAGNSHFQMGFLFASLFGFVYVLQGEANVVELDNSFNELKKNGFWFVEFYAPWCGHCKQLEPIWEKVGLTLMRTSPVVTAKIDCTRFRDLAEEMGIRGFPTIKFFRRGNSMTYRGPRTESALTKFAMMASRPTLIEFNTTKEFENKRVQSDVFFLLIKNDKTTEDYENIVREVAEYKVAQAIFHIIKDTNLPQDMKLEKVPSILVFKDNSFSVFEDGDTPNKTALIKWVDREKFPSFLFASESTVDDLADTGKMIAFVTFGTKYVNKDINKRLGEIVKELSIERNHKYGRHFQFAALLKSDVTESIMMGSIDHPSIVVLEPETRIYYLLPSSAISETFGKNDLASFLDDIINKNATAYGGRTFTQRLRRIWWEIRVSSKDMWRSSPVMTIIIFAIPALVVVFVIIMLCCLEPGPDSEYEDDLKGTEESMEESRGTDDTDLFDDSHFKSE